MSDYLDSNGLRYLWTKIKAYVSNALLTKVDRISGKDLSTNDFTDAYKQKLDGIASGANNYSLPTASSSTLGGIKVGSGLSISNGVLSASGGGLSMSSDVLYSPGSETVINFSKAATVVLANLGYDKGSNMDWRNFGILIPGSYLVDGYVGQIKLSSNGKRLTITNEVYDGGGMFGYIAFFK